ncbi:hypothetical protein SAMN04487905_10650 [Actinopolyspora xinjiangensis]|uniref:Uncharacterized protein n=1 Tax=Actinopolyspora xinjiangensis TaxID=405564 RepID=A0A1H0U4X5_9ACTN|nr:hypothetical protein [Actinopolyspora xinjiangensis]SDP61191.1 hypothetical protein SAMN04487905_10650 [Actinopolyspora xinjiangensis]
MRIRLDQVTGTDRLVLYSPTGTPHEYSVLSLDTTLPRWHVLRVQRDGHHAYIAGPPDIAITVSRKESTQ